MILGCRAGRVRFGRPRVATVYVCFALQVSVLSAGAQILEAGGGTSTLNNATAGTLFVRGEGYEAGIGVGEVQGRFRIGSLVRAKRKQYTFSGGDEALALTLPTDPAGTGSYLPLRSVGLTVDGPRGDLLARAGYSTINVGTSFFRGAEVQRPAAILFADRSLARNWRFFSRNIVADTETAIQGVEWRPEQWVFAGSGGIAGSDPYLAIRAGASRSRLSADASYVAAGSPFRDLIATSASMAERTGANMSIVYTPLPGWTLRGTREHLVAPGLDHLRTERTVEHVNAALSAGKNRFSGGVYDTVGNDRRSVGLRVGAGRRFVDRLDLSTEYFSSSVQDEAGSRSLVTTVRETINPRVTTTQVVSTSDGRTSVRAGGSFLSNVAAIGIDYQNSYAPFAGRSPFVSTLVLSARVNPISDWQVQVTTYTLPNGRPRYTLAVSRFFYRVPAVDRTARPPATRIPKYLVQGRVIDDRGNGISGAVLNLGDEIVITGEDGRFFARFDRQRPLPLSVRVSEFGGPYRFSVVSSPERVTPETEGHPAALTIVVRRLLD
jgi:hypothetical protein